MAASDTAAPAGQHRITYRSPLRCPACRAASGGVWTHRTAPQDQSCPSCGHTWPEAWAGWQFEVQRIIVTDDPVAACETVTAVLDARTVKPWETSHGPRSGMPVDFHSPA